MAQYQPWFVREVAQATGLRVTEAKLFGNSVQVAVEGTMNVALATIKLKRAFGTQHVAVSLLGNEAVIIINQFRLPATEQMYVALASEKSEAVPDTHVRVTARPPQRETKTRAA